MITVIKFYLKAILGVIVIVYLSKMFDISQTAMLIIAAAWSLFLMITDKKWLR